MNTNHNLTPETEASLLETQKLLQSILCQYHIGSSVILTCFPHTFQLAYEISPGYTIEQLYSYDLAITENDLVESVKQALKWLNQKEEQSVCNQ